MLPVYKAIQFVGVITKGARNEPWIVIVRTPNGLKHFVVKLFDADFIETSDCVANEILGNILAREFNLQTPQAALIDFDSSFISSLRRFDVIDILDQKDGRVKFGTELLDDYNQFDPNAFLPSEAKEIFAIDNLFAFDNLIRNADRKRHPVNLLIRSDGAYLIDHELSFDLKGDIKNELQTWDWPTRFWQEHVCYGLLKRSWTVYRQEFFSEFEEYLKYLNVDISEPFFKQLISEGYSSNNHQTIRNYLKMMKENSTNFVNVLKAKIS